MITEQFAEKFRETVEAGDLDKIVQEYFSPNFESIEPAFTPFPHTKGLSQLKEKWEVFRGNIKEMHSRKVSKELVVQGDKIALGMSFEYTNPVDKRIQQDEIILYKVKDGKIISEQFFY